MRKKVARIAGITEQDNSCLAELVLGRSHEVQGATRRTSLLKTDRIDLLFQDPLGTVP